MTGHGRVSTSTQHGDSPFDEDCSVERQFPSPDGKIDRKKALHVMYVKTVEEHNQEKPATEEDLRELPAGMLISTAGAA